MIVVITPTGNIEHCVHQHLVAAGEQVRVIVRTRTDSGNALVVRLAFRKGLVAISSAPAGRVATRICVVLLAEAANKTQTFNPSRLAGTTHLRLSWLRQNYLRAKLLFDQLVL